MLKYYFSKMLNSADSISKKEIFVDLLLNCSPAESIVGRSFYALPSHYYCNLAADLVY